MCIAICKPVGAKMPTRQVLTNCFLNNPHGGGFAFNDNGKVIIKKGYMTLQSFLNAIEKANKTFDLKTRGVLIHTRITTHGGTSPAMTHPFPICSDEATLRKTDYSTDYAVIHNGIISSCASWKEKTLSDTAIFVRDYLSCIASNKNWFKNTTNFELIYKIADSKIAILNGRGEIRTTNGFTKDGDVYFSNTSYKDSYNNYKYGDKYADKYTVNNSTTDYTHGGTYYERKDKKFAYNVDIQRLEAHQTVVFNDCSMEEFSILENIYRDKLGNIYSRPTGAKFKEPYTYLGIGDFIETVSCDIVPFKRSILECQNNLDLAIDEWTGYDFEDEEATYCWENLNKKPNSKVEVCSECGNYYPTSLMMVHGQEFICSDCINEYMSVEV